MPDQTISKIMAATEPADVATMAMIEAIRQLGDNGKATNEILRGMQVELRDVRERVIRIEAVEVQGQIKKIDDRVNKVDERVTKLELRDSERVGVSKAGEALLKYGPFVIALITALFVVLIATKRIVL